MFKEDKRKVKKNQLISSSEADVVSDSNGNTENYGNSVTLKEN